MINASEAVQLAEEARARIKKEQAASAERERLKREQWLEWAKTELAPTAITTINKNIEQAISQGKNQCCVSVSDFQDHQLGAYIADHFRNLGFGVSFAGHYSEGGVDYGSASWTYFDVYWKK